MKLNKHKLTRPLMDTMLQRNKNAASLALVLGQKNKRLHVAGLFSSGPVLVNSLVVDLLP